MNSHSVFFRGRALLRYLALGIAAIGLQIGVAHADTAVEADPPDRAARLSFIEGEVSLQPVGEEEWTTAILNRPLTTGDKLWTDEGARAEIYVGPAAVRLGSDTGFSFLNVDDNTIQMRMTAGVMDVRVRSLDDNDQIEIDTPNLALSLLRPGRYRVEVNDEGDTTVVKVLEGEAEASGGSEDVVVHAQQAATFRGTTRVDTQFGSLGVPDEFDSWTLERDRRDEQARTAASAQYVSPDVTGYEDLDANGTWSSDPEYGYVWAPRVVAVDWAPYRYGRWVWVSPWGWTWIDDAPWGYAPFHYGRWAYVRQRWCWVPGPRHVRAVYAPALVGWVGSPGVNVSISVGGGGVAWFPLGPREVYVPARRYSPRYVERVNVSNTVIVNKTYITNVYSNNVTNVTYRNRVVPGAVTAVSRTTFTSAEHVRNHMVRVDEREMSRVRATGMAPQIQPARQSVLGVGASERRNIRTPPRTVVERQVVVKRAPPATASRLVRDRDERPGQNRLRVDRPSRNDQPAIPDHINRAGDMQERPARTQQQERQMQERQMQERQMQQDAERRQQRVPDDARRADQNRMRDEARRQQIEQQRELRRQQSEASQRSAPPARDAGRAVTQPQDRGSMDRGNRAERSRPPDQGSSQPQSQSQPQPQPQDRERRHPNRNTREP